jgi:Skp family chaperone for outer membrane proteins
MIAMRRISAPFFMIFALLFMLADGAGVRAEEFPKAVVAVLDYAKILRTSDAAKDAGRQIKQYRNSFRDAMQAEEIRLRGVETELKRQRGALDPAVFEKRRREFKKQVIAAQKRGQDHKRQLDRAMKIVLDKIQAAMIPIVKVLTEARGFTLVVDKSQVLFANKALDVTDEVMHQLNQKLRTIKVPKPR